MIKRISTSVYFKEIIPSVLYFILLVAATLFIDALLHFFNIYWIGRYLGILGTLIILFSFAYSLRKRKIITKGSPKTLLNLHEIMAWFGSLLILVHAGVHFNAILPWLATIAMLINVASGLTGKVLLSKCKSYIESRQKTLEKSGLNKIDIEKTLLWDAVALDVMKKWREIHFPITIAFASLGLIHILTIALFWGWR